MKNKIGCLLIHGLGGRPAEVAPLAKYMQARGITTFSAQLKGHTGNKSDLQGVSYREWIESGERAFEQLSRFCQDIFIVGFSMGGLIAANLPHSHNIKGVITVNTPIYPVNFSSMVKNLVDDLKAGKFDYLRSCILSSIKIPFSALIEFLKLLNNTKFKFKDLCYPLFVAQAMEDDVVLPKSALYIYHNTNSPNKIIKFYQRANHFICHSPIAGELFNDIQTFIEQHS
ncbi:carboxylesterase [Caldicoprobacter guelmensis]|uniref:alpha/beta hydrolase n=1 Tax=Caldicoprobacter guelmensis TaxID=1170224 RepID=UPI00195E8169|nr:alpha/beta fold hydrolase [Caldicoprobacter guelmensis]MBM7582793.1 carboxylesterase [Caldicoprobacter guelmensis]